VSLEGPRGTDYRTLHDELAAQHKEANISCYNTVAEAINNVRLSVRPQDRIVVTGSFLTVGAAIKNLKLQC
jgi:folylpolyglutamate synthase/dihydropteroate synthase